MPWYSYQPIDSYPHNTTDPNNYNLVGIIPPNCPNPNEFICAIQANDNLGKPIFTTALRNEMLLALNNRIETTNVLLRPTLL
ncbi:hypothetical protein [Sphingobacterium faecium]|uniref:hypothetical protein n=1 Tax=Sphingobacterium faecium TaxID=34087 RepID=UPI00320949F6